MEARDGPHGRGDLLGFVLVFLLLKRKRRMMQEAPHEGVLPFVFVEVCQQARWCMRRKRCGLHSATERLQKQGGLWVKRDLKKPRGLSLSLSLPLSLLPLLPSSSTPFTLPAS